MISVEDDPSNSIKLSDDVAGRAAPIKTVHIYLSPTLLVSSCPSAITIALASMPVFLS